MCIADPLHVRSYSDSKQFHLIYMLKMVREGFKKKIVEFSTKVGGWGQQWTDFPLIFFLNKGLCLRIILRHTYFFQFLGGGTLLSLDLGPHGVSNL